MIQADSLPTLRVDALQIEQLFLNLIENALKYSGTSRSEGDERADLPPMVTITARSGMSEKGAPEWTFSFEDNGIGIDAEFYDRIFVIFQRLHARSEYSGTGIGLAICQRIVERHSGKIGVQSVPGEGSTFWFTLPA